MPIVVEHFARAMQAVSGRRRAVRRAPTFQCAGIVRWGKASLPLISLTVATASFAQSAFGQQYEVKAPFDSYVCVGSSLRQCADSTFKYSFDILVGGDRLKKRPQDGSLTLELGVPANGTPMITKSRDAKVGCREVALPEPNLALDVRSDVIFFSADVISNMGAAAQTVHAAATACRQLVTTYQRQVEVNDLQEKQAVEADMARLASAELDLFSAQMSELRDKDACGPMHYNTQDMVDWNERKKRVQNCLRVVSLPTWPAEKAGVDPAGNEIPNTIAYELLKARTGEIRHGRSLRVKAREALEEQFLVQADLLSQTLETSVRDLRKALTVFQTGFVRFDGRDIVLRAPNFSWVDKGAVVLVYKTK